MKSSKAIGRPPQEAESIPNKTIHRDMRTFFSDDAVSSVFRSNGSVFHLQHQQPKYWEVSRVPRRFTAALSV